MSLIEKARADVSLINQALDRYDEMVQKKAEQRYQYEMLRLNPETQTRRNQHGELETVRPEQVKELLRQIDRLIEGRKKVLLAVTNTESVEEARTVYHELLMAGNAYQEARDVLRQLRLGWKVEAFLGHPVPDNVDEWGPQILASTEKRLEEAMAKHGVKEVSDIVLL